MYLLNGKKVNIDAPIVVDGVTFYNLRSKGIRDKLGIVEVPDPTYPDPKKFVWTENPDGSLNVSSKPADLVKEETNSEILGQINSLEKEAILSRVVREYMLGLPAASQQPWYAKVKALDDQIVALRARLIP